jgi:hypothetical protein
VERGRRRVAVVAVVEARRGWCSSHEGWKLRVGITAGYGVGAHFVFYRAGEEGSGGGRGVTGGGSVELQGMTVSAMKCGGEWTRRRVSAGKMEKVRWRIDSASSEHGGGGCGRRRCAVWRCFGRWREARLLDARKGKRPRVGRIGLDWAALAGLQLGRFGNFQRKGVGLLW